MTADQGLVLAILAAAGLLFASGKVRADLVALLVVLALLLSGVCSPAQAVAGFGSTVVVLVASLLVVGEGLTRTGIAGAVGRWIDRAGGGREGRTLVLLVASAAVVGSVMNSTAVVALFLPVALTIARTHRFAPGRLLLPLAYGALISGMMTLIATTPNLVVHGSLRARDLPGLGFFVFTPVGVCVLGGALVCFTLGRRWLLPKVPPGPAPARRPGIRDLWREFVAQGELKRLRLGAGSRLAGQTVRRAALGSKFGIRVLAIERNGARGTRRSSIVHPAADLRFHARDVLWVTGRTEQVQAVAAAHTLLPLPLDAEVTAHLERELGVAAVMVHPESSLVGKTLEQAMFRTRHNLHVVGIKRERAPLPDFRSQPLRAADTLLVMGPWARITTLSGDAHDLVVLELPAELAGFAPARARAPLALAILVCMVLLSALAVVPVMTSALLAAVAMVAGRCLPLAEAYRAVPWSSIVLIGGLLPLAEALQRTGGIGLMTAGLTAVVAEHGPRAVLAAIFLITALLGTLLSSTATAVLMAPVALEAAARMNVPPQAFAMTVAIAASSAFLSPVASPVIALVVEPGRLSQGDLLRAGIPLLLITFAVSLTVIPWLLPT